MKRALFWCFPLFFSLEISFVKPNGVTNMHAFVVWQIHVCLFICSFGVLGENTEDEIKPGG